MTEFSVLGSKDGWSAEATLSSAASGERCVASAVESQVCYCPLFQHMEEGHHLPTLQLVCPHDVVLANSMWLGWEVPLLDIGSQTTTGCDMLSGPQGQTVLG